MGDSSLESQVELTEQPKVMKYVAAFMLASLAGSADKAAVKKILESIGAEINAEQLDKVCSELASKNVDEVVAEGMSLLASVPSGGGAAPAEEEKKEESGEESDSDMGFDLFG